MKDLTFCHRSLLAGLIVATASAALIAGPVAAQDAQPVCRDVTAGPVAVHPGDGAPDLAGRIAYAVVGRSEPPFGPIGTQLFAIDPDGSDHVLLLDCDVSRPQWSPDGSRLVFTVLMDDGSWQIATIAADGSDMVLLTSGPGIHEIPSWAPDGTWLVYGYSPIADPEDPRSSRRCGGSTRTAPMPRCSGTPTRSIGSRASRRTERRSSSCGCSPSKDTQARRSSATSPPVRSGRLHRSTSPLSIPSGRLMVVRSSSTARTAPRTRRPSTFDDPAAFENHPAWGVTPG